MASAVRNRYVVRRVKPQPVHSCAALQWCDAKGQPCIIIEQDASGSNRDVVVVDLAPLRSSSLSWAVERSASLADAAGARRIEPAERPLHAVPFDTIPVDLPLSVEQVWHTISARIVAAGAVVRSYSRDAAVTDAAC